MATKTELATKANISDIPDTSSLATKTELAAKANSSDVYSKDELYTKTEIDDLIASAGTGTGTSITADVLQWNNTIASEERAALYNKLLNNIYSKTASFVF